MTRWLPYLAVLLPALSQTADFDEIDTLIHDHVEQMHLSGAGLLVIHNQQIIHQAYYGGYDATTIIPIASASKWLTAATLLTLVDEGILHLETPVSQYLPEFREGAKRLITLRHLLSHTSGIQASHALPGGSTVTPLQSARLIAALPLQNPPGSFFAYGGRSMQVAAGIAELQTKLHWRELFLERIAKPLNMTQTHFGTATSSNRNPMVAGGAFSSLADYGKFLMMFCQNGKAPEGTEVLSPAAINTLMQSHSQGAAPHGAFEKIMGKHRDHDPYSLGVWIDEVDESGQVTAISSPGAFAFSPFYDRERDLAAVFMVQAGPLTFLPTVKLVAKIRGRLKRGFPPGR